jgi:hypothetical protein
MMTESRGLLHSEVGPALLDTLAELVRGIDPVVAHGLHKIQVVCILGLISVFRLLVQLAVGGLNGLSFLPR